MKNCPVCGAPVPNRTACVIDHFAFYEPGQLGYWRGNIRTFGVMSGLWSSICLSFPFINILAHWKHRKTRLVIEKPADDVASQAKGDAQ